jgi:hypothetical protein
MNVSLLVLSIIAGAQPTTVASAPREAPGLVIEAYLSTAGPYGEGWSFTLTPSGDVALEVFFGEPSGSLMARLHMPDKYVDDLRQTIESEHFFDLPAEISAKMVPLHQPDFRLTIILGQRKHKVSLYDPEHIKTDPNVERFLKIWRQMFQPMPVKPSW